MMKKNLLAVAISFAILVFPSIAGSNDEVTSWFNENASTFSTGKGWTYSPGVARVIDGKIVVRSVEDFVPRDQEELRYRPQSHSGSDSAVITNVMTFCEVGNVNLDSKGGLIGMQLVPKTDDETKAVFAVLDPKGGGNSWAVTSVPATTNVEYVIRIDVNCVSLGGESATYSYRTADEAEFAEIATISLPVGAKVPSEFTFCGEGKVASMSASCMAVQEDRYSKWNYASGIVTWIGEGGATTRIQLDGSTSSSSKGKFVQFKKVNDVWQDDESMIWTGNVSYEEFPGYKGAKKQFWHMFCDQFDGEGYSLPGMVLRFKPNDGGTAVGIDGKFNNFNLAGIIVEKGADGLSGTPYGLDSRSSSGAYHIRLGDPSGNVATYFEFNEDFLLQRGYKAGSMLEFFGVVNFDIASGKTVTVNKQSSSYTKIPNVLDSGVKTRLRMLGEGTLMLGTTSNHGTLYATNSVTLDYSEQSLARTTQFLNGNLVVDAKTQLALPKGLKEDVGYQLCDSAYTLTAPSGKVLSKLEVGEDRLLAMLSYDIAAKTVSYSKDLSSFIDSDLQIPEGYTARIVGSSDPYAPLKWRGKVELNGIIEIDGFVEFVQPVVGDGEIVRNADRYARWQSTSSVFTWAGRNGDFKAGQFRPFDLKTAKVSDRVFKGDGTYSDIPGWIGADVGPFWQIFSMPGKYIAPGYALRIAGDYGRAGAIDAAFDAFALGGLIVESGAVGMSFESASIGNDRSTILGDANGMSETHFEFNENFGIVRSGAMQLKGLVHVFVEENKKLTIKVGDGNVLSLAEGASLKMHGRGVVDADAIVATGKVTLDYSGLDGGLSHPFIAGDLKVDESTQIALPDGLGNSGSYMLCGGNLVAPSGSLVKMLKIGSRTIVANVSYDMGNGKISWAETTDVNTATISGNCQWSGISWKNGFSRTRPTVLTLNADARIVFDVDLGGAMDAVCVKGGYTATFAYKVTPEVESFVADADSACEIAIPLVTNFKTTDSLEIPVGETWVIEGGASESEIRVWDGSVSVGGTLKTAGSVRLANEGNEVLVGGRLVVASGWLSYNGGNQAICGTLDIESGATFAPIRTENSLSLVNRVIVNVRGTYDLSGTRQEFSPQMTLNAYAGSAIIGRGQSELGALDIRGLRSFNVLASPGETAADVSARINYGDGIGFEKVLPISIEKNVTLRILGADSLNADGKYLLSVSGEGSVELGEGTLATFAADTFSSGGLVGKGTAMFLSNPSETPVCLSLADANLWTGTCWFRGTTLANVNPDLLGNASSTVKFEGVRAYLAKDATCKTKLEMVAASAEYPVALTLINGYGDGKPSLERLCGSGKLVVEPNPHDECYRLFIPADTQFKGDIEIIGENNRNGVVFGAGEEGREAYFDKYSGAIAIVNGSATIKPGVTWSASNGIFVIAPAALIDEGTIDGQLHGTGIVKYSGSVIDSRPEITASFRSDDWTGSVRFEGAELRNCPIDRAGNPNSKVVLSSVSGYLMSMTIAANVVLEGSGFTVTDAVQDNIVTFGRLSGSGALTLDAKGDATGWAYRIIGDSSEYTGTITVKGENGSLLFGDVARTFDGGAMEFADGYTINSAKGSNWTTAKVRFGETLNVVGAEGDYILKVTGSEVDCSNVKVYLPSSPEPHRSYRLEYDQAKTRLKIVSVPNPPSLTITGMSVDYGVDFSTAIVSAQVSDFWGGYEFSGKVSAKLYAYNAGGMLIGTGSSSITGDGTITFSPIELLGGGQGRDFRFDIVAEAESSQVEKIAGSSFSGSGVRLDSAWFHENADTFKSEVPAEKTGEWRLPTVPVGAKPPAYVEGDAICFDTWESDGAVRFKPYVDESNDVIKVTSRIIFDDCCVKADVPVPVTGTMRAGITIVEDEKISSIRNYAVWAPATREFVEVYGNCKPEIGVEHLVSWTINYRSGRVGYSVDGVALTNANGVSTFALPEELLHGFTSVGFIGGGRTTDVLGEQLNGNLAQIVVDDVTNQYWSVDAAVEDAVRRGASEVAVLWDSTWHPDTNAVGRTLAFVGHRVSIDQSSVDSLKKRGCELVDHGDGSYTIEPKTYELSFEANGGEGMMEKQQYTITNMTFALNPCEFRNAGCDFWRWSLTEDGSDANSWTNCATINMNEFGLTNMTLYAQWKPAIRTLVVETADEFVYVENVTTNAPGKTPVNNMGVRYFRANASTGTGWAEIPVIHGSDVTITFSTDIEKALTYGATNVANVVEDGRLPYAFLPKVNNTPVYTDIELWAIAKGIDLVALHNSPYAIASYELDMPALIEVTSKVMITEYKVTDTGSEFKVTIDGKPLGKPENIANMILVSESLLTGWRTPAPEDVSVDEFGMIRVDTDSPSIFIKILVPENEVPLKTN